MAQCTYTDRKICLNPIDIARNHGVTLLRDVEWMYEKWALKVYYADIVKLNSFFVKHCHFHSTVRLI